MPTIVASTPNCARIPAFERLDEPLPSAAFSTTVTRQPRSASRTAASALVAPPPISTTRSPVAAIAALRLQRSPVALMIAEQELPLGVCLALGIRKQNIKKGGTRRASTDPPGLVALSILPPLSRRARSWSPRPVTHVPVSAQSLLYQVY